MDIGTVMNALQGYEQGVSISTPAALACKRAYLYLPEKQSALPEVDPFGFFNGYTLTSYHLAPNGQRDQLYSVDVQCLVKDESLDIASKIASAVLAAFHTVLDAHLQLGGPSICTSFTRRGKTPTLTRLEWANQTYVGLNLVLDVVLKDSTTVGV